MRSALHVPFIPLLLANSSYPNTEQNAVIEIESDPCLYLLKPPAAADAVGIGGFNGDKQSSSYVPRFCPPRSPYSNMTKFTQGHLGRVTHTYLMNSTVLRLRTDDGVSILCGLGPH